MRLFSVKCEYLSLLVSSDSSVEGVQRRATKLVQGTYIGAWKYNKRLQYLGLSRLDKRRVRSDSVETFEIINGMNMILIVNTF